MFLSVVLPAYNEAQNLPEVLKELKAVLGKIQEISQYEIIVCDDHSSDNTYQALTSLGDPRLRIIRLSRRSGSHIALRAGLNAAQGEAALCLSADGQDDPHVLEEMIRRLKEGNHTVWAVRKKREEPFLQKLTALLFYRLLKWFFEYDRRIDLANADFFLLHRKVVHAINHCREKNTSLFGLILWAGFKQESVTYERRERRSGKSKWNFKSKVRMMKDWIISFSGLPLKVISVLGMILACAGLLYALVIFILALGDYTTPGWAESFIVTLITSGTELIILGVIGEYLWKTLDETRQRPLYFIEEDSNENKHPEK